MLFPLLRAFRTLLLFLLAPLLASTFAASGSSGATTTWFQFVVVTLGLFALLKAVVEIAVFVYEYVWLPRLPLDFTQYAVGGDKWAVVTGASDGIGKAFVEELAAGGLNVLLVSRTAAKMQRIVEDLRRSAPKVRAEYVAVDFSSNDDGQVYGAIAQALEGKQVTILVNNVGSPNDPVAFFEHESAAETDRVVRTNVVPSNKLTQMILPQMIARRCGLIIFDSSLAGRTLGTPYFCTYSGTKSYQRIFAHSLSQEVAMHNIQVQCLLPGPTHSQMTQQTFTDAGRRSFAFLSANDVAHYSLARALYCDSRFEDVDCVPCATHFLLDAFGGILPKPLSMLLVLSQGKQMFNTEENRRKAAAGANSSERKSK